MQKEWLAVLLQASWTSLEGESWEGDVGEEEGKI